MLNVYVGGGLKHFFVYTPIPVEVIQLDERYLYIFTPKTIQDAGK